MQVPLSEVVALHFSFTGGGSDAGNPGRSSITAVGKGVEEEEDDGRLQSKVSTAVHRERGNWVCAVR